MNYFKYIAFVILGVLFPYNGILYASNHVFTVVIDPGHGGHDPGAIGARGKEKDINLRVALKVGELIKKSDDTKIIFTRKTDIFIPLDQRAKIANDAHADLFISIHTNSIAKGKNVMGAETYTLGLHRTQENLDVAKKENSVIVIENNYKQRYAGFNPNSSESYIIFEFLQDKNMKNSVNMASLVQNQFKNYAHRIDKGVHQAGFLVLRATSMPSVLIELGYISTPKEEAYLLSNNGVAEMAQSIYNAFIKYKNEHKGNKGTTTVSSVTNRITKDALNNDESVTKEHNIQTISKSDNNIIDNSSLNSEKPIFKIQIFTSNKKIQQNDKLIKDLPLVNYYKENGLYKYTFGDNYDYNRVLKLKKENSKRFKDSFIISFKQGKKTDINEAIKEYNRNKNINK